MVLEFITNTQQKCFLLSALQLTVGQISTFKAHWSMGKETPEIRVLFLFVSLICTMNLNSIASALQAKYPPLFSFLTAFVYLVYQVVNSNGGFVWCSAPVTPSISWSMATMLLLIAFMEMAKWTLALEVMTLFAWVFQKLLLTYSCSQQSAVLWGWHSMFKLAAVLNMVHVPEPQ